MASITRGFSLLGLVFTVALLAVPSIALADALDLEGSATAGLSVQSSPTGVLGMHRLYNPYSGEHFYTSDDEEFGSVVTAGWTYEGIGWTAPETSNTPVYRVYNPYAGEHHYTMDVAERDSLVSGGWVDEGIGWYSDDAQTEPLYRQYNPNEYANNHNYTKDASERDGLVSVGWRDEGIGWYGSSGNTNRVVARSTYVHDGRAEITVNTYDSNGYLVREEYERDYEPLESDVASIEYAYDAEGVLASISYKFADGSTRRASIEDVVIDGNGRVASFSTTDFEGPRVSGSYKNYLAHYAYDDAGNIACIEQDAWYWGFDDSSAVGAINSVAQYDENGLLLKSSRIGGWVNGVYEPDSSLEREFSLTLPQDIPGSPELEDYRDRLGVHDIGVLSIIAKIRNSGNDSDVSTGYLFSSEKDGLRQCFYSPYDLSQVLTIDYTDVKRDESFASAFAEHNNHVMHLQ